MFAKVAIAALFAAAAAMAGCSSAGRQAPPSGVRIVTLMPSFAEDLCAIGAGKELVGVSEYSQGATCAAHVPAVANFSSLSAEKIVALHPSVVVAIPAQQLITAPLRRAGIRVEVLPDDSYDDIFSVIRQLGALSDHRAQASELVARLHERTRTLQASEHNARHPRVFVVLQAQPIWTVGPQSYISTMLKLAGARNAVTILPRAYAEYSAEALLRLQPDAIVSDTSIHLESFFSREPWRSMRAVREKHVFILKDAGIIERPGPNYNEGLSWLIEHLRPLTT